MQKAIICLILTIFTSVRADNTYQPTVQVWFSPNGGCTEAVVTAIENAKKTILVQAYSFTSAPIAKALVNAHKRGVEIGIILDKSQTSEKYSSADFVAHAEIPVWIDRKHSIAHNKIMVIDSETVITGSFNFTLNAESHNAENLVIMHGDSNLAKRYTLNWKEHLAHSEEYAGK